MSEFASSPYISHLPPRVREGVGSFLRDVLSSIPDRILSVALTGSCITGDYVPGRSDVNFLLVLEDVGQADMDALASMGRRYGKKGLSAPLIMTPEYIERSLDVFPVEFHEIKLIHSTVYGREFFSDLPISKPLLRLQCERELKSRLIRLHQGYVSSSGRARGLNLLLKEACPGYFPIFRAMLAVVQISRTPPLPKNEVMAHIESAFGMGLDAFREIGKRNGTWFSRTGLKEAKALFFEVYRITHELSLAMDHVAR